MEQKRPFPDNLKEIIGNILKSKCAKHHKYVQAIDPVTHKIYCSEGMESAGLELNPSNALQTFIRKAYKEACERALSLLAEEADLSKSKPVKSPRSPQKHRTP